MFGGLGGSVRVAEVGWQGCALTDPKESAEAILIVIKRLLKWVGLTVGGLVLVAALGVGGFFYYDSYKREQRAEKEAKAAEIRKSQITAAQENATSEGKEWTNHYQSDPASKTMVARFALVESNDGLCKLTVEERLNGTRLTKIVCPLIEISPYDGLEVKFDFLPTSYRLPLKSYSDTSRVFIPSSDDRFRTGFYDEFIKRLKTGSAVAIKTEAFEGHWMTFTLYGAEKAISTLGKPFVEPAQ